MAVVVSLAFFLEIHTRHFTCAKCRAGKTTRSTLGFVLSEEYSLKGVSSELETVSKNLARAQSDSQYDAVSKEFEKLTEQKSRLEKKLKQLQTKTDMQMGGKDQVDRLLQNVDRLMELVDRADGFTISKELFELVNLRVFLRFEGKKLKKRTVNKVAGGMVTFGDAKPPVKLYNRPTSSKQLKKRSGKREKRRQNNDDDEISSGEDQSSRNVNRDDWRSFEPLIAACVEAVMSPNSETVIAARILRIPA